MAEDGGSARRKKKIRGGDLVIREEKPNERETTT